MSKKLTTIILLILTFIVLYDKTEKIDKSILIKSNEIYEGKSIYLKNNTELPMIVVGDTETEPRFRVENITISDVIVDGNMHNQKYEIYNNHHEGIRNSGIVIRGAENVIIRNSTVRNCRSGGIVIEKKSKNILIENCEIYANYFDGIAGYDSEKIVIRNCKIHSNRAAALSFDLQFNDVLIENCVFHHNETAVFIRDCKNISFKQIKMLDNRRWGWYITQRDEYIETMPENVTFFEIEDDSPNTLINTK